MNGVIRGNVMIDEREMTLTALSVINFFKGEFWEENMQYIVWCKTVLFDQK